VARARQNAAAAGVEDWIAWSVSDHRTMELPDGPGLLVANPEYGVRLGATPDLIRHYRELGEHWRTKGKGKSAALFCGNSAPANHLGLTPVRVTDLYNGNLPCRLLEYRL
jgi:putative N6-adenine-specific DNA methylase